MPPEPAIKRAVAFVDGQNLFFAAWQAFGYAFPNHDFPALATAVCTSKGWNVEQARFYTGIPDSSNDPFWSYFWAGKLRALTRQGVEICAEIRVIANEKNRWIKIASAFPVSPTTKNKSGIRSSDWIKIDRVTYDSCLDARDYRPKKTTT